jgi:hypothetical protein
MALTQAHWHPDAKVLIARRKAASDGGMEALRVLKRRLSTSSTERYWPTSARRSPEPPLDRGASDSP